MEGIRGELFFSCCGRTLIDLPKGSYLHEKGPWEYFSECSICGSFFYMKETHVDDTKKT